MNISGVSAGCPELLSRVKEVQPKLHVFGHIHESYGSEITEDTTFVNAASIDKLTHNLTNAPVVIGESNHLELSLTKIIPCKAKR